MFKHLPVVSIALLSLLLYYKTQKGPENIRKVLLLEISSLLNHQTVSSILSKFSVLSPTITKRMFNNLRHWEKLSSDTTGFNFTIMSYNVLAQDLVVGHRYLYTNHDPKALSWNVRWNNLLAEIKLFKPDILCLQEVQSGHLQDYFSILERTGYKGVYKKRTGPRTDGCAIYYKDAKIKLVEHTSVEYNQPNCAVLDRDNIALIAKFAPIEQPQREFVVATTHLLYNPRRHDVRLAQTQLLLAEIDRISFKPDRGDDYLPVLLTGDFNSQPYSAVYRLIKHQQICLENVTKIASRNQNENFLVPSRFGITDRCQHADLLEKRKENQSVSRTEELNLIKIKHPEKSEDGIETIDLDPDPNLFSSGTLTHKFPLQSVYQHFIRGDTEGTTCQDEWITVDYIFFTLNKGKRSFKLLERFRLPLKSELEQNQVVIPNEFLGSDHFSLVAKFKLEYF